uniref:Putative secreted protein n=1 Tax=Ixodes ricinus TaxID=34613 RepID=A0A6B0U8R1_IXORI
MHLGGTLHLMLPPRSLFFLLLLQVQAFRDIWLLLLQGEADAVRSSDSVCLESSLEHDIHDRVHQQPQSSGGCSTGETAQRKCVI